MAGPVNFRAPASRAPECSLYRTADALGRVIRPSQLRAETAGDTSVADAIRNWDPAIARLMFSSGVLSSDSSATSWERFGIVVERAGCDSAWLWVPCPDAACEKPLPDADFEGDPVSPFLVGDSIVCGSLAASSQDYTEAALRERFAATKLQAIERMFWCGPDPEDDCVSHWEGQYLMDEDCEDLTPADGPASPAGALGLLEQLLATSGQMGAIHVSFPLLLALAEAHVITPGPGGIHQTICGTPVFAGSGYDPCCGPGGATPDDGTQWMAATGIPTILEGEEMFREEPRLSHNEHRLVIEQPYLVFHSGCVCGRVLVNLNCAC